MIRKIKSLVGLGEGTPEPLPPKSLEPFTSDKKDAKAPDPVTTVRDPRSFFKLKPGYSWNPSLNWPPNKACLCGSGIKFKKCHKNKISPVIETARLKETIEALRTIELAQEQGVTLDP